MDHKNWICSVCGGACSLLDVVDFNKSCDEASAKVLGLSGISVSYALCGRCGFCFAPELSAWTLDEFERRIYNDQYVLVDPDYVERRPGANAAGLTAMFRTLPTSVRHLDYGGGNGLLAKLLQEAKWDSTSYDPFVDRNLGVEQLGKFDLITAFEVFEHVPDVRQLMSNLRSLLAPNGLVLLSTLLSDGNIQPDQRINWWYASPRNGHISLFSRSSLATLAQSSGLNFASFSDGLHVLFTQIPPWAAHVIQIGSDPSPPGVH
jgi:SAM-dependent methyltransferase